MQLRGSGGEMLMNRGYPSLFAPDSDEEFSSDSDSANEDQTRPTLLPLEVSKLLLQRFAGRLRDCSRVESY